MSLFITGASCMLIGILVGVFLCGFISGSIDFGWESFDEEDF